MTKAQAYDYILKRSFEDRKNGVETGWNYFQNARYDREKPAEKPKERPLSPSEIVQQQRMAGPAVPIVDMSKFVPLAK